MRSTDDCAEAGSQEPAPDERAPDQRAPDERAIRSGWRPLLRLVLAVALSAGLVALLVTRVAGATEIRSALARLEVRDLRLPLALGLLAVLLSAERWRLAVDAGRGVVSYRLSLYAVLVTWPAAVFTPSRMSDLLRAWIVRPRVPLPEGLGAVAVEKLVDAHSLLVLGLVGALWGGWWRFAAVFGFAWLGFWTAFMALHHLAGIEASSPRGRWVARLGRSLRRLVENRRSLGLLLLYSFVGWVLSAAVIASLLAAIEVRVAVPRLLTAWPLATVAAALPITLTGFGARDATFLGALLVLPGGGLDRAGVLTATLLYPLLTTWIYALLGAPFTARYLTRSRNRRHAEPPGID